MWRVIFKSKNSAEVGRNGRYAWGRIPGYDLITQPQRPLKNVSLHENLQNIPFRYNLLWFSFFGLYLTQGDVISENRFSNW